MAVEFDRREDDRGPRAVKIRRAGTAPAPPPGPGPTAAPARPRPPIEPPPRPPRDTPALTEIPLPRSTQAVVARVRIEDRHPGLQLDKLVIPGDQERQRDSLANVTRVQGDRGLLAELRARRGKWLKTWPRTTTGPLTLHLARANVLENAGLCLHPVYGFAYLPGSGLKGMARAFATEMATADPRDVEAVFGNEPGETDEDRQTAGGVIFHDAWPADWPTLAVDITNNHHPKYYQGGDAPGDWDSPVPVYFLAIHPGTTFEFAVAARRVDGAPRLVTLAREWLDGALTASGAGAKTAAGYGTFRADGRPSEGNRRSAVVQLELISPAFLAGAAQDGTDCDLRTATLRGQLRWWWRTLHAGFLSVDELRSLEAAIWGDTNVGSAVRIELTPRTAGHVTLYAHPAERQSGTRYVAYGMDESVRIGGNRVRKQRYVMAPGASWELRITTRRSSYRPPVTDPKSPPPAIALTADEVREQALAACWLMAQYGGVGSKGRKGFGSLDVTGPDLPPGLDRCRAAAEQFRRDRLKRPGSFSQALAESPSISDPSLSFFELNLPDRTANDAVERIGRAFSATAAQFKHDPGKAAWGLPRKVHGPMDSPLPHQQADTHQPPEWLDFPKRSHATSPANARHASPIHLHVGKAVGGGLVLRSLALPAKDLPDHTESARMLRLFDAAFRSEISSSAQQIRGRPLPGVTPPFPAANLVEVTILERMEKSGPNAFRVQEDGKQKGMVIHGTPPNPLPAIGDKVRVYREPTSSPQNPTYRWSAPAPSPPPTRPGNRR
nr:type III-B CRISPR module RAMP protein Cmr6 [Fimbriiglobus ruber]